MQSEGLNQEILIEPPNYYTTEHIFDISFHPKSNFIACGTIGGEARILAYNEEETVLKFGSKVHSGSCRATTFSPDGLNLASGGVKGDVVLVDQNGSIKRKIDNAHSDPIFSLMFLNQNLLASGDDDGIINIWDLRTGGSMFTVKNQKGGTISDLKLHSSKSYLLSTSTNGHLAVYDLRKPKNSKETLYAISDEMEDEYNTLILTNNEQFVVCGNISNHLAIYKWDFFGDSHDRLQCGADGIDSLCQKDDNLFFAAGEDGWIRAVSLYPHVVQPIDRHANDLESTSPISKLSLSHCKNFLASIGHDMSINFFDVSEFGGALEEDDEGKYDDVDRVDKNDRKREKKMVEKKDRVDFFDDL